MASETGREARDGYSLVSYDDGTFGWETDGGRSRAGYRSKGAASTQGKRARAAEVADLASADPGHAQVDTMLEEIQQRVSAEYLRAYEEAEAKLADYLRRFEAKDRIHAESVRRGEETEADYREWRRGQILVGKRWQEMVDTLAEDYRNADRVAASIVNGHAPDAYAVNHDYATFQVERGSNLDTSYTLYDRATVERLIRDRPDLLPAVRVDGKRDLAWNRRHIASAITQGVLQGESMDQVARRIRSVADMDYRAAMRTARTAMTSAQNAGRVDAYRRAEGMGIHVRKQWLATLDRRTRHSHRRLDGEVVGMEEGFSNGLRYPGDPESGRGSEVYNCRCTLVPVVDGADPAEGVRHSNLGGVSYEEWRNEHATTPGAGAGSHTVAQGRDIVGKWKRRADQFDFEIEDVMAAQGYDGVPRLVDSDEFDELVKQANGGRGFIAQRSYTGTSKEVADEYRRMLYEGKWYVDCSTGGAQYGQGMYCAADYTGKLTDGIKAEMEHYTSLGKSRNPDVQWYSFSDDRKMSEIRKAMDRLGVSDEDRDSIMYAFYDSVWSDKVSVWSDLYQEIGRDEINKRTAAGYDVSDKYKGFRKEVAYLMDLKERSATYVETMTLDPSAKVISYRDLLDLINDEPLPPHPGDWDIPVDAGAFASAKGYDAINAEGHGESGSYTVVLNRTKLIIRRPEGWR